MDIRFWPKSLIKFFGSGFWTWVGQENFVVSSNFIASSDMTKESGLNPTPSHQITYITLFKRLCFVEYETKLVE